MLISLPNSSKSGVQCRMDHHNKFKQQHYYFFKKGKIMVSSIVHHGDNRKNSELTCPQRWYLSESDSSPHSTRPGHPKLLMPVELHPAQFASSLLDIYLSPHKLKVFQDIPEKTQNFHSFIHGTLRITGVTHLYPKGAYNLKTDKRKTTKDGGGRWVGRVFFI